jgi:hypothetical protein
MAQSNSIYLKELSLLSPTIHFPMLYMETYTFMRLVRLGKIHFILYFCYFFIFKKLLANFVLNSTDTTNMILRSGYGDTCAAIKKITESTFLIWLFDN